MLSTLLLPPVEQWWEQQIQIGLAADKPQVETMYTVSLEFKIHHKILMWSTQWLILLSERECCWDLGIVVVMACSNAREAEKRFISYLERKRSFHFFSPQHLPIVFLPCSVLILLCSFSTLLVNLTWIFNSELSGLERKALGTGWKPSVKPGAGHACYCNSSARFFILKMKGK